MYSTRNYVQYLVKTYEEKESGKYIYFYKTESLCYTLETNTTLRINSTAILKNGLKSTC